MASARQVARLRPSDPVIGDDRAIVDYARMLRRWFSRRLSTPDDAEDLAQEVFCRLKRRGESAPIHHPEAYIFQTASNVLVDHLRHRVAQRHALTVSYDDCLAPADDLSPERVLLGVEAVRIVTAAIQAMPDRARQAFVLFRFEGMKQTEIAAQMGISLSAVEKHIKLGAIRVTQALRDAE